jgi:predicted nucleic acid-binding protein
MNYLLDTNIVLIYAQASPLAKLIEKDIALLSGDNMLFVSVVTVGEVESLMFQRQYGEKKKQAFRQLLKSLTIIDINIEEVISRYAEIDAFSQGKHPSKPLNTSSRNMGKNDLWIAATSSVYNMVLITTDYDFNHLEGEYLSLKCIDPKQY